MEIVRDLPPQYEVMERHEIVLSISLNQELESDEIKWFKDGRALVLYDHYQVSADGNKQVLSMNECSLKDGGTYHCQILKHKSEEVKVTVTGKI